MVSLLDMVGTESNVVCLISASKCERCLCMLTVISVPLTWGKGEGICSTYR